MPYVSSDHEGHIVNFTWSGGCLMFLRTMRVISSDLPELIRT